MSKLEKNVVGVDHLFGIIFRKPLMKMGKESGQFAIIARIPLWDWELMAQLILQGTLIVVQEDQTWILNNHSLLLLLVKSLLLNSINKLVGKLLQEQL